MPAAKSIVLVLLLLLKPSLLDWTVYIPHSSCCSYKNPPCAAACSTTAAAAVAAAIAAVDSPLPPCMYKSDSTSPLLHSEIRC
jgi:hypothetical protein